jgi:hypothetical protein
MQITTLLPLLSLLTPLTSARSWTTEDECPTTIKTLVSADPCGYPNQYCSKEARFETMDAVHAALSHCPNITALDLRVTGLGCSEWPPRWDFPLHPWGGEKYPNLTSLRLEGYHFGDRGEHFEPQEGVFTKWRNKFMSVVRMERTKQGLIRPVPNKTHLDLFMDALDFSAIQDLALDKITPEMLTKLPPALTSLRALESTNSTFIAALPHSLTNLTWISTWSTPTTNLSALLLVHPSLEHLDFRTPELVSRGPFAADFDAAILPLLAPNLTHVSLNVPRNGTWPLETLRTLASLPKLRSAHLYTNLQSACAQQRPEQYTQEWLDWRKGEGAACVHEEQFQKPWVDGAAAQEVWEYMRSEKKGDELAEVTIFVGDWTRAFDGPLYFPDWLERKRSKVVCTVDKGCEVVPGGEEYWTWWGEGGKMDYYLEDLEDFDEVEAKL